MIDGKTFTALIFAYNEEQYILEALESVLVQKGLDRIVFIDDQSTDNTLDIVSQINSEIPIQTFVNTKKGKANAFAYGLTKVETDYFFVVHGDDVLLPDYIVDLYNHTINQKIDFCYANSILCDENLNYKGVTKVNSSYSADEILLQNKVGGYIFGKSSIIENIIPFPCDLSHEDWFMNIKLAIIYKSLYVFTTPKFKYRRHIGSDTIRLNKKLPHRSIRLINRILEEKLVSLTNAETEILKDKLKGLILASEIMDYLFLKPEAKVIKGFLSNGRISYYLKSLILIRFFFGQSFCKKVDSFVIDLQSRI